MANDEHGITGTLPVRNFVWYNPTTGAIIRSGSGPVTDESIAEYSKTENAPEPGAKFMEHDLKTHTDHMNYYVKSGKVTKRPDLVPAAAGHTPTEIKHLASLDELPELPAGATVTVDHVHVETLTARGKPSNLVAGPNSAFVQVDAFPMKRAMFIVNNVTSQEPNTAQTPAAKKSRNFAAKNKKTIRKK